MHFFEIFTWNFRVQFRSKRIYNTLLSSFIGLALLILIEFSEIEQLSMLNLYLIAFVLGGVWSMNYTAMNMIGLEALMWPIYTVMPNDLGRFLSYQSLSHGLLSALFQVPLMMCFLSRDELNENQKCLMFSLFFLSLPLKIVQSLYVSIYRNFYQERLLSSRFVPPSFAPILGLMSDVFVLFGCFLGIYYYNEAKVTAMISVIIGLLIIALFMIPVNTKLSKQLLYNRRFLIFQNIQKGD